ncbi:MAG: ribosome biogenesis GTPase Der [Kosmotoga sp.]|nr:MAG: ribosome biogenesis GTPase Der [Kosmotoga sp.]
MATVLIVGRPNVGKSTLFNRLVGYKKTIVDDEPGVTRDFVFGHVEWQKKSFEIVDTCGLFDNPNDIVETKMKELTLRILDEGDLIIFVVDGRNELTSADYNLAKILRPKKEKVLLVANKIEVFERFEENSKPELYSLGLGEPIPVSSEHSLNIDTLIDTIFEKLEKNGFATDILFEEEDVWCNISIVGQPNVGKSSLFNTILGSDRSLVTEIPGTTRDTIDQPMYIDEKLFKFIDTAGIRKKSKIGIKNVEYYSVMRSVSSIERSDISVIVIDATKGVSKQDQKVAGLAEKNGKGTIVVFNKVDLISEKKKDDLLNAVENDLYFISYSPVVFTSCTNAVGIDMLIDSIIEVSENIERRIPTGLLNELIKRYTLTTPPVGNKKRKAKIYYASQIDTRPPLILLNVNDPGLFSSAYLRGLRRTIRMNFHDFAGSPIFIKLRGKR